MEEKLKNDINTKIEEILNEGINVNNLDHLYKLSKIKHMMKEEEKDMYNDYGRRYEPYGNYSNYSNYNNYGRRGVDAKYRGHDYLERAYNDYSRYEEGRRYGTGEETKKALEFMLRSMEDFARMLKEDAKSPEEQEMIRQALQRMAQM